MAMNSNLSFMCPRECKQRTANEQKEPPENESLDKGSRKPVVSLDLKKKLFSIVPKDYTIIKIRK